ncbi:MAG: DUF4249 family protein [Bacteroidales bacterium]|nr:DUF4249 family protein [Bacteroidales bacterium]
MKSWLFSLLIISGLAFSFSSCETDFDTTTEYKDITVVYGILDQKSDTQFIKINKAYLSETDVLTYAANPDSNQYINDLEVKIEEFSDQGNLLDSHILEKTTVTNKEAGQFYYPDQIVYFWKPDSPIDVDYIYLGDNLVDSALIWFDEEHTYKLSITNPASGKVIASETNLVKEFRITYPSVQRTIKFLKNDNSSKTFSWNDADNAGKYEFELRFNFRELLTTGEERSRYIVLSKASVDASNNTSEYEVYYKDLNFYSTCENLIPYDDQAAEDQVSQRFTGLVEVLVRAAEENLSLYMEVNEPSTSIIQEKPQFSNVDNGIGIFSSRYYEKRLIELDDPTKNELINNEDPNYKFVY